MFLKGAHFLIMSITTISIRLKHVEKYIGRYETVLALALLFIAASFLSPVFLTVRNLLNILLHVTIVGIIALGMTFVISMGGIDLSVGSVLAFASICASSLLKIGTPVGIALLIGLCAGALCGAVNGLLIVFGRLPPFIVTLGMMGIARGSALIIAQGRSIYGFPRSFLWLGQTFLFNIIPIPAIFFIIIVLISYYVYFHTRFGHYTIVIGDNEEAAKTVGIPINAIKIANYIIVNLLAAFGGILFAARLNAAEPTAGVGYELDAIAAVVIGGTNLFGGQGTVLGSFIGIILVGLIRNILNLLAVSPYYQQLVIGMVLIGAVLLDTIRIKSR